MFDGITVLMPVYNSEVYLKEAIDSVLNQTYKNFEFLIIDDGSSDYSLEIINSYSDNRIRLIRNETNLGITQTLNKGIEEATYELIARMDADDVCLPHRLQKQFDYFLKKPHIALLASWAKEFSSNKWGTTYKLNPSFYYYNLVCECWIYHSTVMFKKSAVKEVGKYQYQYCEDYDLWWRLSRHFDIAVLPETLLDYRLTDDSLSRKVKKYEYTNAHRAQLVRNVQYYTGPDFLLTENDIDFLMIDLKPICETNSISIFIKLFRKLESLDTFIFQRDNAKIPLKDLKRAAQDKKHRIVFRLFSFYKISDVFILLFRLGYWRLAFKYIKHGIKRKSYDFYRYLFFYFSCSCNLP